MKNFFKKYWPSLVHLGSAAAIFIDPAVQHYATSHKGIAAVVYAAWGIVLHWAQSPKNTPASGF